MLENASSPEEWRGTEMGCQGGCGITTPGDVQEPWRCGIEGCGLVLMVVMGLGARGSQWSLPTLMILIL